MQRPRIPNLLSNQFHLLVFHPKGFHSGFICMSIHRSTLCSLLPLRVPLASFLFSLLHAISKARRVAASVEVFAEMLKRTSAYNGIKVKISIETPITRQRKLKSSHWEDDFFQ